MSKEAFIGLVILAMVVGMCHKIKNPAPGPAEVAAPAQQQPAAPSSQLAEIARKIAEIKPVATGVVKKSGSTVMTKEDWQRYEDARIAAERPIAIAAAQAAGLADPNLVLAMHLEEARPKMCLGAVYGEPCDPSGVGALGPMQFMPGTWKQYGVDADGDGKTDPQSIVDSMFATAKKLKADGGVSDKAVQAYNPGSKTYVAEVRAHEKRVNSVLQSQPAPEVPSVSAGTTMVATAAVPVPEGCVLTQPHGNVYCPNKEAAGIVFFKGTPVEEICPWFDSWGDRRKHEKKGEEVIEPHAGVDFACNKTGQKVASVCNGIVGQVQKSDKGMAGLMVRVDCADGKNRAWSMHMASVDVDDGQPVAAGMRLGGCGNSGNAKNQPPHVHFRLDRKDGSEWTIVNPCAGPLGTSIVECRKIVKCEQGTRCNPIVDVQRPGPVAMQ